MNLSQQCCRFLVVLCLAALPSLAWAQRPNSNAKPAPGSYNIANDVSIQGTIVSYAENSTTTPPGAHAVVQTPSGNVDVHLGDARLLHLAQLNLAPGGSVRFVGQSQTIGSNTVFLARLVQVGSQVLAVRSVHGLPVARAGVRSNKALVANVNANQQGGAR